MSAMKIRAQVLRELENAHGRVTASLLVTQAKNPKHPLHGDFTWDDKKAGHEYRLSQARQIINSVRVVVTTDTLKFSTVGYVKDPAVSGEGYVSTAQVRTEAENAHAVLLSEVGRLQSILERVKELAAALDLQDEAADLITSASEFVSRIRKGSATEEARIQ
jgi:hypothetical protein